MSRLFIAASVVSCCIAVTITTPALATEWLTADVYLNQENKGDFSITLTDQGKILFARKDLLRLGLKDIPTDATIGDDGYISLSPRVIAELDRSNSRLYLTINPDAPGTKPEASTIPTTLQRKKASVHLNGEEKGEFFITQPSADKILFARKDLSRLGINNIPSNSEIGKDGYVSLAPQVVAEFDEKTSIVYLTVNQALLASNTDKNKTESPSTPVQTEERIVTNVQVNHEDKGDLFLTRTDKGHIFVKQNDLPHLGIATLPAGISTRVDGGLDISLLAPQVRSQFDEKASVLYLTVAPELLGKTSIDLERRRPSQSVLNNETTGFVNYGLSYTADDNLDFSSFMVPLEAGITTHGYLGVSSFSYTRDVNEDRFVRLMTSVIKDNPEKVTRIIAGDFSTSSGMLGSGGLFGGLSIAKQFAIDPYSLRYPGASLYGAIDTPSDVEVYINGLLVGKEHLSPGEFEFLNVGNMQGSGEATLVIKNTYGQVETITVPYYTSAQLLRSGLSDYSYSIGYKREDFGLKSSEYGDAAFLGYHRVGISDVLTAGMRAEADANVANVGANASFLIGTLGEVDTSVAFSRDNGTRGTGWAAHFSRSSRYVSGGIFARGFSRDYATLTTTSADDKSRLEATGSLGFRHQMTGSVSFFYSMKDMYIEPDRRRFGVNYNRRLASDASLNVVAARTVTDSLTSNEIFANLTILLGRAKSATIAYQRQGDETAERISLQKNAPLGTGTGYRLISDRKDDGQGNITTGGDAYLQYRGNHGVYSAEHRRVDGFRSTTIGTTGGIAFINQSAYFTRPIYDGYVLAKVGTFENVAISYNNQPMGVTDKNGELLIPDLISYHLNNVSFNDKDIPVNYELADINKSVTVPYRSGGVVRFDIKKIQAFTGRLVIREHGKKTAAEYWGLKIAKGGKGKEVIVGKKGEFYLENLPAGKYPARLFNNDNTCSFLLSVPDSDASMVDMGEVICEKN